MPTPHVYWQVSRRYRAAAIAAEPVAHEVAGFSTYHSFESAAAALLRHVGKKVPRRHDAKLNAFAIEYRRLVGSRAGFHLGIVANGVRNRCLYPSQDASGQFRAPDAVLSQRDVANLRRQVDGMRKNVAKLLGVTP
jgi:hypothetical protein